MTASDKRVALVTGAGQGIGRGIALKLAADGYRVVINDIVADPDNDQVGAYEVKNTIEQAGGEAEVFRADIASSDERQALIESIDERFGRLDLLVNNAGVAPKQRLDLLETTEESFDRLISINLKGPFFLSQLAAQKMIEYRIVSKIETPRIVFITSISAYTSSIGRGEYCISKTGLSMAAQLFADRLAEYNIPVIEVRPGIVETPMTSGVKEKYDRLIADGLLPTRRWGRPEDVAGVVSAIGRGDLDYSTGVAIDVSGGFNLRRL